MAKFIEMVGTAGVGKTTTYNYLLKHSKREIALFYEDLDRLGNGILKPDFILRKLGFQTANTAAIENDHFMKFVENNRELMDMFWDSLLSTEPNIRFHRVKYLKKIICKIQRIIEDQSKNNYILDEGLIHNFHYFTVEESRMDFEKQINNLLNHTEPPAGILFFKANSEIIMERTLNRKKKLGGEIGLTHEELLRNKQKALTQMKKCIEILEGKEIPVLQLDPYESVIIKAKKINDFILRLKN